MEINILQGNGTETRADTLIVSVFDGESELSGAARAVDAALGGALKELLAQGDLSGTEGEVSVVYPRGTLAVRRIVVVGLGKADKVSLEGLRKAAAAGIKKGRELKAQEVALAIELGPLDTEPAAQAVLEGALLALYRYAAPKQGEEKQAEIGKITLVVSEAGQPRAAEAGARAAEALAAGVYLARDLVNMPANTATPTRLAEAAQAIAAGTGMQLTVGDREWAAERKMGAFLGVAQGAAEPPKFIVLEYNPGQEGLDTIVLVGKGITFDSGGLSLKPVERMGEMKSDMGGAAAVLGTMQVVGQLGLPLHVIGIAPCTENMPDGKAYRPGDVLAASNGKTIEIISTDAEGRLALADALVYAQQFHPKAVIDLATLTGACVVALGNNIAAGLFSNQDELRDKIVASGEATRERLWPMPLWDEYRQAIKSEVADLKNSGGRYSGVGTSAIFLKEFTDYPWAHLDIAGMALSDRGDAYRPAGATGYGVRLLVDFLRNWAS